MKKLRMFFLMLLAASVMVACNDEDDDMNGIDPDDTEDQDDEVCEATVFNLVVPESTPEGWGVFIAGEMEVAGVTEGDWQQPGTNPDLQLTDEGDGVFSFTFPTIVEESFEFKFFIVPPDSDGDWGYGESDDDDCETSADNRTFTPSDDCVSEFSDVVLWENICD